VKAAWHAGEQALQRKAGVDARMAEVGARVLRDHMPEQHRTFFAQLPFLLAGTLDPQGHPVASLLAGPPGFVSSPSPQVLRIDAVPLRGDGADGWHVGAPVGLLGLEPHTRRRNRLNGWVAQRDVHGVTVQTGQSFGNCPKYITPRQALYTPEAAEDAPPAIRGWDDEARRLVREGDTFFIATAHPDARGSDDPTRGVDVSHRGGPPGFVQVADDGLLVPDYAGNTFFNTFGNLLLEPRCGLLFLDVRSGDRLALRAEGSVEWDAPELARLPGAHRLLRLRVLDAVRVRNGTPLRWREPEVLAQL
jgi:predicted pyridoxine 5'-phosphate oxidase superfamily flavin-nucleotide-binding protein